MDSFASDYQGPRHYVAIKCPPTGNPGIEWCERIERDERRNVEKMP